MMLLKIYLHRLLLITTLIFVYIFILGVFGPLQEIFEIFDLIIGASIVVLLKDVLANYGIKELMGISFALVLFDSVGFHDPQFKENIYNKFRGPLDGILRLFKRI